MYIVECCCGTVLTIASIIVWQGTRIMLAVVVILAVCGYCSAQCSTTPPAGLTVHEILTQPADASNDSRFY